MPPQGARTEGRPPPSRGAVEVVSRWKGFLYSASVGDGVAIQRVDILYSSSYTRMFLYVLDFLYTEKCCCGVACHIIPFSRIDKRYNSDIKS